MTAKQDWQSMTITTDHHHINRIWQGAANRICSCFCWRSVMVIIFESVGGVRINNTVNLNICLSAVNLAQISVSRFYNTFMTHWCRSLFLCLTVKLVSDHWLTRFCRPHRRIRRSSKDGRYIFLHSSSTPKSACQNFDARSGCKYKVHSPSMQPLCRCWDTAQTSVLKTQNTICTGMPPGQYTSTRHSYITLNPWISQSFAIYISVQVPANRKRRTTPARIYTTACATYAGVVSELVEWLSCQRTILVMA